MQSNEKGDDGAKERWFVLQAHDQELGHPVAEARFKVAEIEILRLIIGAEADGDAELSASYELSEEELAAVCKSFPVAFDATQRPVSLTPWHSSREAPYLNHAGFELPLMLEGRKPFAKFSEPEPCEWLNAYLAPFERFVADGRLLKRVMSRTALAADGTVCSSLREVYFAVRGQEWRIDAYILLVDIGYRSGWTDAYERYEGALLGYDEVDNDWHLARRRRDGLLWYSGQVDAFW